MAFGVSGTIALYSGYQEPRNLWITSFANAENRNRDSGYQEPKFGVLGTGRRELRNAFNELRVVIRSLTQILTHI